MKKILTVFNKLVFLSPRLLSQIRTVQQLSGELQKDFLVACMQHIDGFPLMRSSHESDEEFIIAIYKQFEQLPMLASGFTPYFAKNTHNDYSFGFNCLGRAIAIGSFLKSAGYKVKFGLFPGHAIVILQFGTEHYYCDVARNYKIGRVMVKMHGSILQHKDYGWYTKNKDDLFFSNCLIIQDFDRGIINGLFTNFSFLASKHTSSALPKSDAGLYSLTKTDYGYMDLIQSINWKTEQKKLFGPMNMYVHEYKEKYLLERQRLEEQRYLRDLHLEFDKVIVNAFESAVTKKTYFEQIKDFHSEYNEVLQDNKDEILRVLAKGVDFSEDIPLVIQNYFYAIRDGISHNEELKEYALFLIEKRCTKKTGCIIK